MSKFGELINQAKEGQTGKPENRKAGKPENQKTSNPENIQTGKPANRKTGKMVSDESDIKNVNLSIKVPENLRRHWVAESKREGTSITAEITEALNRRFGNPNLK